MLIFKIYITLWNILKEKYADKSCLRTDGYGDSNLLPQNSFSKVKKYHIKRYFSKSKFKRFNLEIKSQIFARNNNEFWSSYRSPLMACDTFTSCKVTPARVWGNKDCSLKWTKLRNIQNPFFLSLYISIQMHGVVMLH